MEQIKGNTLICDTDVLVDLLRGYSNTILKMNEIELEYNPAISIITYMELIVGCINKKEYLKLETFLNRFALIKVNEEICDISIDLLKNYKLKFGLLIPDALIAATCLELKVPLFSMNIKVFRYIEGLSII